MTRKNTTIEVGGFHSEGPALVIGAAGVDIVGQIKEELRQGTSNPARMFTSFGGVARNVAENLSRLGQPVKLVTAVGDDAAGRSILNWLESAGVGTDLILTIPGKSTGTYLGIINAVGELQVALDDMGIISQVTADYIHQCAEYFEAASMVYLDTNPSPAALRAVISMAWKVGAPVCADPTSTALAGRLEPHLAKLFMITPNCAEAAILSGCNLDPCKRQQALESAKALVSRGVKIVIIALGSYGVCYATSETSGYVPAIHTEVVNPTGAGDALAATVMFGLLNNLSLDDAVRLGVSAASLTLNHRSSVLPDLSLEKLYDHLVI